MLPWLSYMGHTYYRRIQNYRKSLSGIMDEADTSMLDSLAHF